MQPQRVRARRGLHEIAPATAGQVLETDRFLHPAHTQGAEKRHIVDSEPDIAKAGASDLLGARRGVVFDVIGEIKLGYPLEVLIHCAVNASARAAEICPVLQLADAS